MKQLTVPFLDLGSSYRSSKEAIDAALRRVAESGWYLMGQELAGFEASFARFCGAEHCVGVGNGLDALHLALLALGVGEGDEVIVPSNTFIATWLAVSRCGATIVPVEPVEATYNIDPDRLRAAITGRTKVVLPVHLYGQPADMDAINAVAREHGLKVLDDCAQAHGATYKGRPVGSLADISAWSFYPGKNLGAFGDAGGITTNDASLAERVRMLGNYGSRVKYRHEEQGFNSRMDEIQAAVLAAKLKTLTQDTDARRRIARQYMDGLEGLEVIRPAVPSYADPSWHLFVIRHAERDQLQARLAADGVSTLIHYPTPPHLQQAYARCSWSRGSFPISERIHEQVISLPMWSGMSQGHVARVIDALGAACLA
jgi:dTDP-4-amino-4,6-dideoxygalactose transaminase